MYELQRVFNGYIIARPGKKWQRNRYIKNIANGRAWIVTDHAHARHYSKETAEKHLKALNAGLYELK